MRKLLTILALFASLGAFAQSESHVFVTKDTMLTLNYDPFHTSNWYVRMSYPADMFTANDTAPRPAIFMMEGAGEMGHDTTKLTVYGPHSLISKGVWDGSVVLGNGTHYPLLFTIICDVSPPQPPMPVAIQLINYLIKTYHVNPRGVHLTGLSEGAFTWTGMLGVTDTTGTHSTAPDVGMKFVTSIAALSGAATNYSGTGDSAFWFAGHWAKKYGGKSFLTVGYADAQTPNPPLFQRNSTDSMPGSSYFTYNTIGSGSHCCWDTVYLPTHNHWQSFSPLGTFITTSTDSNSRGTYVDGESLFQWMLRQGDTTLVGTPPLVAKKVATAEYWNGILATNDTIYAIQSGGTGNYDAFPLPSGELAVDIAPGFNQLKAVSSVGHYYNSNNYNVAQAWHQVTTDTTGAGLNNVLAVWSMANGAVLQRSDSSLWLADNDTVCLIHAPGTFYNIGEPIKMSASGVKYVKVDIGANGIYGLTSDGNLDLWVRNSQSLTPTRKYSRATAGGMMDVSTCNSDMVVGIIRNSTGDTTAGNVYALGASWGDIGGTSVTYSSFTNIMTLLGLTAGTAKRVSMSGEAFHVINTSGQLYGVAKCNAQGELGNGVEWVNRYTYSTYPGIGWTFDNTEHPVAGPMVLVDGSTVFTDIYDNKFFTFYKFAKDASGNLWSWGRGKTNVLGNGQLLNPGDSSNQFHPNAVDVTKPTLVNPFTAVTTVLHFVTPFGATSTANQTIGSSSTTLTAAGTPITLNLQSSPFTKIHYNIVSYAWTKTSGGSATIVSASSATTSITGLSTGVYHFQVLETDDNGGQDTAGTTVTVTATPPTVTPGSNQNITLPTSSATVSMTVTYNGGATGSAVAWTTVSIPSGAATPTRTPGGTLTAPTCAVSGLTTAGTYVFQCGATDSNSNTVFSNVSVIVASGAPGPCINCFPRFSKIISH